MRKSGLFILAIIFYIQTITIIAQNPGRITGHIWDENPDYALQGVQIFLKEKSVGTTSGTDGKYTIEKVPAGEYSITASMIGYNSETTTNVIVESGKTTILNFTLKTTSYLAGEVVVSATKTNKPVGEIPAAIYVMGPEEIERTNSRNIDEVLETVPGVFSQDRFHAGYNNVSFRGMGLHSHNTRGILVLVDGIPLNDAMGQVNFEQLNLDNAEQIEILKGPVSALYGPNGVTGAINVVSKSPPVEWQTNIEALAGSYRTYKLNAGIAGMVGNTGLSVNATHYQSDGYTDRNKYETNKISARLNNNLNSFGSIIGNIDYVYANTEYPGPLNQEQFDNRSTVSSRQFTGSLKNLFTAGLSHNKYWDENTNLNTIIFYRKKIDDYAYSDSFSIDKDIDNFGGEIKFHKNFKLFQKNNSIVTGINYVSENGPVKQYSTDSLGNKSTLIKDVINQYNMIGIYAQNDFKLFSTFTITLGLRYDIVNYQFEDHLNSDTNNSVTKSISALSPKLALVYVPGKTFTIYANIGKGFNPPITDQLFVGGRTSDPNPDLAPEYLMNYELGVRSNSFKLFSYQLSAFWMDFQDQIITDDITGRYENIGLTNHKGFEASANSFISKNFSLTLAYAYLLAKFEDYPGYNGNYIKQTPQNQLSAKLLYQNSWGFKWDISLLWLDSYYMDNENVNEYDGHAVVNTRLSYAFGIFTTKLNVNNLLDANYATYASASYSSRPAPGSWSRSYYSGWPVNVTLTLGVSL